MIFILIFLEIVLNTMLYIIFQYGLEPLLIQRISISFESTLENDWLFFFIKTDIYDFREVSLILC